LVLKDSHKSKHIYLASDFHLGVPNKEESRKREKKILRWLDSIADQAQEIHLVGDVWDFWFEYKQVVPKGTVRLLGKLAFLVDAGIDIHFYTGNHDLWTFGYLEDEIGIQVHREPVKRQFFGENYLIGHGDGLGPGDYSYKFLKKVFANSFCQWALARIHPNLTLSVANYFSRRSRIANAELDKDFHAEDEWLYQYCQEKAQSESIDYFIFGHRHLPLEMPVGENSIYYNLGEWIQYFSYIKISPESTDLLFFESNHNKAINK
jgi:UDP-2,3-diacylglucosamine hydrolase